MRVAFFHGLDSEPITRKNIILREVFDDVYDPFMDYRNNQNLFNEVLNYLKDNPVDLIIGSSMGGYFAHCLSTHLGTRTLLFNPAMHSRPIEPVVSLGYKITNHYIILGKNDDVIDPNKTIEFFNGCDNVIFEIEDMGHVIDLNIFKRYLMNYRF